MSRFYLDIQQAPSVAAAQVPDAMALQRWAQAALREDCAGAEVSLRFVDEAEGLSLNTTYRHKDYATNILSFAYDDSDFPMPEIEADIMRGDLVVCVPVVYREAAAAEKNTESHFAHLIVHGMLHLQGYDHEEEHEAEEMEAIEVQILQALGYESPYA